MNFRTLIAADDTPVDVIRRQYTDRIICEHLCNLWQGFYFMSFRSGTFSK